MPTLSLVPASFEDFRKIAERRLPRTLFDYIDGGAYDEATLRRNVEDLRALKLKQRVMRDVSNIDTSIDLFGRSWSMPLALAPIGLGGMAARRGELQAKRAADTAGVPFCLSTVSVCSLEEVARDSTTPFWFQLYMLRDRGVVSEILARAKTVGVRTLVFTVDLAVVGARYRDMRNGMSGGGGRWVKLRAGLLSYMMHPAWLYDVGVKGKPHTFGNLEAYVPGVTAPADFKEWVDSQFDPSVTWKDIEWIRKNWDGDLLIKGVLTPEDARAAALAGANAVVVSNHGGRQLDGALSSIAALPRIVDAVGGEIDVLMDSGVRSGLDVVRARALGAKAVMIGRPWVYAVAARGEAGVRSLLQSYKSGMDVAMALTAARSLDQITRDIIEESD